MKNLVLRFVLLAILLNGGCNNSVELSNSLVNSKFSEATGSFIMNENVELFSTSKEYLAFVNSKGKIKLNILQADNPNKIDGLFINAEIISNQNYFLINPINQGIVYVFVLSDYIDIDYFKLIEQEVKIYTGYGISYNNSDFSDLLTTLRIESLESIYQPGVNIQNEECTGGGEGSFGCFAGDNNENCSVICQTGYYGCCKSKNLCKCIAEIQ